MSPLPDVSYVDAHVPDAKTEQEFLRLAVQAALRNYRDRHSPTNPLQPIMLAHT